MNEPGMMPASAIDFPHPRPHHCLPRGRPGFDGGCEVAWSMPRASSSSLNRWQTIRRQRRRLRSRRL